MKCDYHLYTNLFLWIMCWCISSLMTSSTLGKELQADVLDHDNERQDYQKTVLESFNMKDRSTFKLSEHPKCKDDIARARINHICPEESYTNNLYLLECFQTHERDDSALLSDGCHHVLWSMKYNMTQSGIIDERAKEFCAEDLQKYSNCSSNDRIYGHTIISCMTENIDRIVDERCRHYLFQITAIVFSDYHLVRHMAENCEKDIKKFECGRIQQFSDKEPHSQGLTIECLSRHIGKLDTKCHTQILRLAELQSEDFHLDRALFFACRGDRDKFCKNIRAGKGRVYKCLMNHKKNRNMSPECADQLVRRQNLAAYDYKVSQSLAKSCHSAIVEYQCRKGLSEDSHDIKLSKILLCLEGVVRSGKTVDGGCQDEMLAHRQMVLENFNMSPDIMASCDKDIPKFCDVAPNSDTLHCLMKQAKKRIKKRKQLSDVCLKAIQDIIKETDPSEDWRADPVLYEACLPVVQGRCKNIRGGEGRVMRCLMRQLNSQFMTPHCEAALLEIQYFVARDWKLDPQLYRSCYNESTTLCHAQTDWTSPSVPDSSILILPCLFRYAYHPNSKLRLSQTCTDDVHRVMHERAAYVDLHPQIEMTCMESLASICSENTAPGEEISCLQRHLHKLDENCMALVKNYTEAEAHDIGLNNLVTTHCQDALEQMCGHVLQNAESDGEEIMNCLIENKNAIKMKNQYKCRAVIEDFQIIMLQDISFTPMFKTECREDVQKHCSSSQNRKEVLECLSSRVLMDIINDDRTSVSKKCKQQLRKQISQRNENIKLDPELKKACLRDIKLHCDDVLASGGVVLECLRKQQTLHTDCHRIVFQRELEESSDPLTDVVLTRKCKQMIKIYCREADSSHILSCLMREKERNADFDERCAAVIVERLIEKTKDIHLNPLLLHACKKELSKYCQEKMLGDNSVPHNGKAIECLKEELPKRNLNEQCSRFIIQITKNAALNYKMDPILNEKCSTDMETLCLRGKNGPFDNGEIEECLKNNFQQRKIESEQCREYIAQRIQVERADLTADPVLFRACGIDDALLCKDQSLGEHLACLYEILDRQPERMRSVCVNKLKERRAMYSSALKVAKIESIEQLIGSVRNSSQSHYLYGVLFTFVGLIFVIGACLGRVSSNRFRVLKNR